MSAVATVKEPESVVIGELPLGRIEVDIDHAELPQNTLFSLAARNNPKRAFLFLSHVLGKHLPVTPMVMEDIHQRIARKMPELPQPVVFVGMAETATCLGQGVFEAWQRAHPGRDALYLHTTRYAVPGGIRVDFEEAHSHAPMQWLYLPEDPVLRDLFRQARSLVLIDDEISTGSTFINLARACTVHAPSVEHVHFAAITDFTGPERKAALSSLFDATISIGALLYGQWRFEPNGKTAPLPPPAQAHARVVPTLQDGGFGRRGRSKCLTLPDERVRSVGQNIEPTDRVLVLGTGEFMHPAFVLARDLRRSTGAVVQMHATTRSPILAWGPIDFVTTFPDNYGEGIQNYLYNCHAGQFDHVFLCHETGQTPGLVALAGQLGARLLHFRSENEIEENPVR